MTVDAAYRYIQFLARKNQTGSITPTEFAIAFNSGQRSLFKELLGPIAINPHLALGQDMRISERLKPFKYTDETIAVSSQIAPYPAGFAAITLMVDAATGFSLQYLDDTKLTGRLKSVIDPIAEANPAVFTSASNGWKVWPATVASVKVSYYKIPADVKWNFTEDEMQRPVYTETDSVHPLWDDISNEEILARACTLLGISFEKQSLVQFGEGTKTQGL